MNEQELEIIKKLIDQETKKEGLSQKELDTLKFIGLDVKHQLGAVKKQKIQLHDYMDEYRSYVKDCVDDNNFDLSTMESWHDWIETEEYEKKYLRCKKCESLNTASTIVKKCTDCGHKSEREEQF